MGTNSGGDSFVSLVFGRRLCFCTCVLVVLLRLPPKDFPHLQSPVPLLFLVAIHVNGQSRSVTFTGCTYTEVVKQTQKKVVLPGGENAHCFDVRGAKLKVCRSSYRLLDAAGRLHKT